MAHSTFTKTQTGQDRVFKETGRRSHPQGERSRLASSREIGRRSLPQGERQESGAGALILRESGAGWRPLTSLGPNLFSLLSPHWHSCRRPPSPAGRRQKLFADNSPPLPCVAPLAASLLLANQAQDIHLAANSSPHYHFCANVIIANLVV